MKNNQFDTNMAQAIDIMVTVMLSLLLVVMYAGAIYSLIKVVYNVHADWPVYFPLIVGVVMTAGSIGLTYYVSYYFTMREIAGNGGGGG
jgi:uncharacterized BrkB/YihY/UPF0761 family membrane protein